MSTPKTNPNDLAFPAFSQYHSLAEYGLTKKEMFAAMAMQGFLSDNKSTNAIADNKDFKGMEPRQAVAIASVNYAEALIEALNASGKESV